MGVVWFPPWDPRKEGFAEHYRKAVKTADEGGLKLTSQRPMTKPAGQTLLGDEEYLFTLVLQIPFQEVWKDP